MSICSISRSSISRIFSRFLHLTAPTCGPDSREKRKGHIKKSDKLEGEYATFTESGAAFELIDENLMNRVIDHVKFKDIPIIKIRCTKNNTKISVREGNEKLMVHKSAGTEGYKNCRKGTTVAAQAVANRILTFTKDHNINMVRLVFAGLGPGRGAAYQVFENSGIKVVSLSDRTEAIEPWIRRPRKVRRV